MSKDSIARALASGAGAAAAGAQARVVQRNLLARIRSARSRALSLNCRDNPVYSGVATVTDNGATLPAVVSKSYAPGAGYDNRGVWHIVGGLAGQTYSSGRVFANYRTPTARDPTMARCEVMANSRYFAVEVPPATTPYRFIVDDGTGPRFLSKTGTILGTTTGTTHQYILIDFGTRATRKISVDLPGLCGLYAAWVETEAMCWPVDLSTAVHGAVFGDSYVIGAGATIASDGLPFQLGDLMGASIHAAGVGGTGWTTADYPTSGSNNFLQRIALNELALSYYTPDFIVTMVSYNDRNGVATIADKLATGLQNLRAQYPGVPIVVMGVLPGGYIQNAATFTACETAAAAAVATITLTDPLVTFVPVMTDANGAWLTGKGCRMTFTAPLSSATSGALVTAWPFTSGTYTAVFADGSSQTATFTANSTAVTWSSAVTAAAAGGYAYATAGSSPVNIATDGVHPDDSGHSYIGRRYAASVMAAIEAMLST